MQICFEKEFKSGAEEPSDMFSKNTYILPSQKLKERRGGKKEQSQLCLKFYVHIIFSSAALLLTPSSEARWHPSMNKLILTVFLAVKVPLLNVYLYIHFSKEIGISFFSTYIIIFSPRISTEKTPKNPSTNQRKLLIYLKNVNVRTCFLTSDMTSLIASSLLCLTDLVTWKHHGLALVMNRAQWQWGWAW